MKGMELVPGTHSPKMSRMDHFFTELGRKVLAQWKEQNFCLEKFPDIARLALEEKPPAANVDLPAFIKEFLLNDEQPFQTNSGFGQPELIVYDNPRFYIQILFWLDGTTQIHQHEFSGAFHVLAGSSIHSLFSFEKSKSVSAHFRVGDLRMQSIQLLETGRTVPIVSGRDYIHSLFHLETPSLTVVVRTHNDPGTSPQFTYLPPHLAIDPFYTDALTTRRTQLLDVLERINDPTYPELVLEMIDDLDFERGFFILQNGLTHLKRLGEWETIWSAFEKKHGSLAAYVAPTLEEILWRDRAVGFRNSVVDVEHRFFLALLLNAPNREHITTLIAHSFPGDPLDNILRWAEELGETSEDGTSILDATFPEEMDTPPEKQLEVFLAALGHFLKPQKAPAFLKAYSLSAEDLDSLRHAFAQSSLRALVLKK